MNRNILIVDDHELITKLINVGLKREGFPNVISVSSGIEALVKLRKLDIALIVLDIMMPDISGIDVLRIIKNDEEIKHTKVLMLTANKSKEIEELANKLGCDKLLHKPFQIITLVEKIRELLEIKN